MPVLQRGAAGGHPINKQVPWEVLLAATPSGTAQAMVTRNRVSRRRSGAGRNASDSGALHQTVTMSTVMRPRAPGEALAPADRRHRAHLARAQTATASSEV